MTEPRHKFIKLLIVLSGIILGQAVLYGPSLCGQKILLPLDILAAPHIYLPRTPETAKLQPENIYLSDLVYLFEPERRFAVSELHAGRVPLWLPSRFAGAPYIEPKFSPFQAIQFATASPVILAWAQMFMAIVAGLGAWRFFAGALDVTFWPATIAAWCYPLTGFFIFWQGYPTGHSVYWFPWLLLAVHCTARRTHALAPLGLSLVTCLVLISGHPDVGCQALLASGLYALWCLWRDGSSPHADPSKSMATSRPRLDAKAAKTQLQVEGATIHTGIHAAFSAKLSIASLAAAWVLGMLLATPYLLPLLEYTQTSTRMERRSSGQEERPPVGLAALPQAVLPDMYGAFGEMKVGSFRYSRNSQVESTAAAYAGMLTTLFLAPLAWCSRRHRSMNLFWSLMGLLALSWCLNVPGIVQLLRLPGLNMMSHNRLVFITAFAILSLSAIGLEVLLQGPVQWRPWLWLPPALLATLYFWCSYRALSLPEPIQTQLETIVQQGHQVGWMRSPEDVQHVQSWFVRQFAGAAALSAVGVAAWLLVWFRRAWQPRLLAGLAVVLLADLLWFGYGKSVQCDPGLYFPRLNILTQVAQAGPGRVIGYECLPANLATMSGLREVRGYDGVDPAEMIDLLSLTAEPNSPAHSYSLVQWLAPGVTLTPAGDAKLSPVLDLLGVRYVIFRGSPWTNAHPAFQAPDYWVLENPSALPRVFVPGQVQLVPDKLTRLQHLASPEFEPRSLALVETPIQLPRRCHGTAELLAELPSRLTIAAHMETPGLLVLTDRWDKGWQAFVDGKPTPILRVDHALRGVILPAGSARVEFRYAPASFAWGLRLSGLAGLILLAWSWQKMRFLV